MSRARADPRSQSLHLPIVNDTFTCIYTTYTVLINVMLSPVSLCVIVKILHIIR